MTKSSSVVRTRQSDLQPLYDAAERLHPTRLYQDFMKLPHKVRWSVIIAIATVVLMFSVFTVVSLLGAYIRDHTGPMLTQALQAPFNLEQRTMPIAAVEDLTIFPATAANFTLGADVVAFSPARLDSGDLLPSLTTHSLFAHCTQPVEEGFGCFPTSPLYVTSGTYQAGERFVELSAALFEAEPTATSVFASFMTLGRQVGQVGNYATGIGAIDYAYISAYRTYHFMWSHGPWVFTAASTEPTDLEAVMKALPF
ncbi:MAG TPA: hypothetical protein PLQ56_17460 [Aggregatilineales bacterium]|nr:hypothetical protein [Aggregatilineales bacterium]